MPRRGGARAPPATAPATTIVKPAVAPKPAVEPVKPATPTVVVKPTATGPVVQAAPADPIGDAIQGVKDFFAGMFQFEWPKIELPKLGQADWSDSFPEKEKLKDPYLGESDLDKL